MRLLRTILYPFFFAGLVASLLIGFGGDEGRSRAQEGQPQQPAFQPAREIKETPPRGAPAAAVSSTPNFKLISMAEAVTIAEKTVHGYSLKAERLERPVVTYRVEVVQMDGGRTVVDLASDGKVLAKGPPAPPGMGKKKGGN